MGITGDGYRCTCNRRRLPALSISLSLSLSLSPTLYQALVTLFHVVAGDPWPESLSSFREDGYVR